MNRRGRRNSAADPSGGDMSAGATHSVEELTELLDNVNDVIYSHDLEGNFLSINSAGAQLFGYSDEELTRLNISDVVDAASLPRAIAKIQEKARGDAERSAPYQLLCHTRAGQQLWLEVSTRIISQHKILGVARDVTARRRYEERLKEMSMTDTLTGLYNTRFFWEILQKQINNGERYHKDLSLILMDIDDFKVTNDRFGHLAGDELLRVMGGLIKEAIRTADFGCRYGGEEFTVVLPDTTVSQAVNLAERLRTGLGAATAESAGARLGNTVSLGVAEYYFAEGSAAFVERADHAMYEAKRRGKNATIISMNKRGDSYAVV